MGSHSTSTASTPLLPRRGVSRLFSPFPNSNLLWKTGSLIATAAVITGTFGAHALKKRIPEADKLHPWETASHYAFFNGIALLAIPLHPRFSIHRFAGPAIGVGTMLFSGSIWGLTLDKERRFRWLGPVTPLGGMVMIAGIVENVKGPINTFTASQSAG